MALGDNMHSGRGRKLQKMWRIDDQHAACHCLLLNVLLAELSILLLPVLACWPACWAPAAILLLGSSII